LVIDSPHARRPSDGADDGITLGPRGYLPREDHLAVGNGDLDVFRSVRRVTHQRALDLGAESMRFDGGRFDRDEVANLSHIGKISNRS